MTQFILLSLLLAATIQLPLVSVTNIWLREGTNITLKFPQGCDNIKCCKGNRCANVSGSGNLPGATLTRCALTINKLSLDDHYSCSNHSHILDLYLLETTVCLWSDLPDVAFLGGRLQGQDKCTETIGDCRRLCTGDPDCQYFTFNKGNKTCFLIQSRNDLEIEFNTQFVSGHPRKDGCKDTNDDVVHLQYHQEAKSWIDALEYCQDRNSSLVEIRSEAVQRAVQRAVKCLLQNKTSSMQDGVWIGLERSIFGRHSDPWMWISGSEVGGQTQWNSSHPVDPFNNHCGKIVWVKELQELKWLDACCHEKLPFICQDLS